MKKVLEVRWKTSGKQNHWQFSSCNVFFVCVAPSVLEICVDFGWIIWDWRMTSGHSYFCWPNKSSANFSSYPSDIVYIGVSVDVCRCLCILCVTVVQFQMICLIFFYSFLFLLQYFIHSDSLIATIIIIMTNHLSWFI